MTASAIARGEAQKQSRDLNYNANSGSPRRPEYASGLGLEELKALFGQAMEEVARLKKENAELREEIARLKGLKGRPKLKPSDIGDPVIYTIQKDKPLAAIVPTK